MENSRFQFDRFILDCPNRVLLADGEKVELTNRYFDALSLLVRNTGNLVSKEQFHREVWHGVPVTDEALTQCVKTLRKLLGDDAVRPQFIETVPKHGYRFIASLNHPVISSATNSHAFSWRQYSLLAGAGIVGGGLSGFIGGILYGFVAATPPFPAGSGAGSIVIVLMALCIIVALAGASGVSLGIAVAIAKGGGWTWHAGGGAFGGLVVGGLIKLLGLDAFNLVLGTSLGNVTGAMEGAAIGGTVGLGVWLSRGFRIWPSAILGAAVGGAITALGGQMMAGSLELLAQIYPQSPLRINAFGELFGEQGLGPLSQVASGALEGCLFSTGITAAILVARHQMSEQQPPSGRETYAATVN